MKIMATCSNCQHDLLLSQLVEGPGISGTCPWCGTLLAPHYTCCWPTPSVAPSALGPN
jgi:hypothetical protein